MLFVCVYVCICVCALVCILACLYAHIYACVCVCVCPVIPIKLCEVDSILTQQVIRELSLALSRPPPSFQSCVLNVPRCIVADGAGVLWDQESDALA